MSNSSLDEAIVSMTKQLKLVKELRDNNLFAEVTDPSADITILQEWFFENDIIAKYYQINVYSSDEEYMYIWGFQFKTTAGAMAFKLRWD